MVLLTSVVVEQTEGSTNVKTLVGVNAKYIEINTCFIDLPHANHQPCAHNSHILHPSFPLTSAHIISRFFLLVNVNNQSW